MPHLTRRTLLASAAILAGDAALAQGAPPAPPASSAPPARTKGPLVGLHRDQKARGGPRAESVCAPPPPQNPGRRDPQRGGARAHRRTEAARLRRDADRRPRSLRQQDA